MIAGRNVAISTHADWIFMFPGHRKGQPKPYLVCRRAQLIAHNKLFDAAQVQDVPVLRASGCRPDRVRACERGTAERYPSLHREGCVPSPACVLIHFHAHILCTDSHRKKVPHGGKGATWYHLETERGTPFEQAEKVEWMDSLLSAKLCSPVCSSRSRIKAALMRNGMCNSTTGKDEPTPKEVELQRSRGHHKAVK